MNSEKKERQELIVWVYTLKHFNKLKRYGMIHYASKRMNYIVMYVDQSKKEEITRKLSKLHFVRKVEDSPRQEVDMNFEDVLGRVTESSSLDDFQDNESLKEDSFFSNDDILGTL